jgi:hypothetical protein
MKLKLLTTLFLLFLPLSTIAESGITTIEINNTFSMGILFNVKCDHNYQTQRYDFYRDIDIPGRGKYILKVPNHFKRCEIWPIKIRFF